MAAAASSVIDYLFHRSLEDLVKGLRNQPSTSDESRYVSRALSEIRKEIKSLDPHTKSSALLKLAYLHQLHSADISWASFHILEVMSLPRLAHRSIGYLAASDSFTPATDVLLLATNLLQKNLKSKSDPDCSLAITCLSRVATPDLARDLLPEIFTVLTTSRISLRKKSTLLLLKIFLTYPEAIKVAFKRLVEKIDDPEPQVVSACVTVLHELARDDPRRCLPLAPELHRLLSESSSNWICIKVVKIFKLLMPLEPRLAKKIAEPLCQQMRRTGAKSLIVECIRAVSSGLLDYRPAVELAAEKLKEILNVEENDDANLKYLGLNLLLDFLPSQPWMVAESKPAVLRCLTDGDPGVQSAALRLVVGMVSDGNLGETVEMLTRLARGTADRGFCNELVSAVLAACSRRFYELITDFAWYVGVLGELARLPLFERGAEVERQLVDIGLRVESVRPELFRLARSLLVDSSLWENHRVHRILAAAAWIAGEYVEFAADRLELVGALLQPRLRKLPAAVQAVYLQAVLKALVASVAGAPEQEYEEVHADKLEEPLEELLELIKENAGALVSHVDTEVQERASNLFGLIGLIESKSSSGDLTDLAALHGIFNSDLGPVSQLAQQRVAVPEGLELLDDLTELKQALGYDNPVPPKPADGRSLFVRREAEVGAVDESAELLAKHRQKNESFYLPKDARSEDFPRAENFQPEPPSVSEDKLKVAEETLVWNKPRRPKPRSVVIKLIDEEAAPFDSADPTPKAAVKDSVLSDAIRDALSSKSTNQFGEPSSHRSSRRHRKEKPVESPGQQHQEQQLQQQQDQDDLKRSKKHHRKRAKSPWKVAPQEPVVPDFLL